MATIANIFDRFTSAGAIAERKPWTSTQALNDTYRLRPLPNEDVYFYAKRIDNSRVVRQVDPIARARSWRILGGTSLASILLIGMLLPSTYGLIAGYQVHTLQQENHRLEIERARLELEEARLVSAQRLQDLADKSDMHSPKPESVIYLTPKNDTSLALNRPN